MVWFILSLLSSQVLKECYLKPIYLVLYSNHFSTFLSSNKSPTWPLSSIFSPRVMCTQVTHNACPTLLLNDQPCFSKYYLSWDFVEVCEQNHHHSDRLFGTFGSYSIEKIKTASIVRKQINRLQQHKIKIKWTCALKLCLFKRRFWRRTQGYVFINLLLPIRIINTIPWRATDQTFRPILLLCVIIIQLLHVHFNIQRYQFLTLCNHFGVCVS